jgi:hypothetical protein
MFTSSNRYFTINLQNKVDIDSPIHLEIRYHQSTNDISEIYNWILFINCMLTNCIYEINTIIKDIDHPDIINSKKFKKISASFVTNDLVENNFVNVKMFNLLFDRFVKNQTLKNFYRSKCRDLDLSDNNQITPVNDGLHLHPPKYFDENGKVRHDTPLNILQKNVNYNVWKLNPPEPFTKPINELLLVSNNESLIGGYYFRKYLKYKYKYLTIKNNKLKFQNII